MKMGPDPALESSIHDVTEPYFSCASSTITRSAFGLQRRESV
jgi:hypothetical protein